MYDNYMCTCTHFGKSYNLLFLTVLTVPQSGIKVLAEPMSGESPLPGS